MPTALVMEKKLQNLLRRAFERGVANTTIHETIPQLSVKQVSAAREAMGFSARDVIINRYKTWRRMVEEGFDIEQIAVIYKVKPRTIQYFLWASEFSFRDSKKQKKLAQEEYNSLSLETRLQLLKEKQLKENQRISRIKTFSW